MLGVPSQMFVGPGRRTRSASHNPAGPLGGGGGRTQAEGIHSTQNESFTHWLSATSSQRPARPLTTRTSTPPRALRTRDPEPSAPGGPPSRLAAQIFGKPHTPIMPKRGNSKVPTSPGGVRAESRRTPEGRDLKPGPTALAGWREDAQMEIGRGAQRAGAEMSVQPEPAACNHDTQARALSLPQGPPDVGPLENMDDGAPSQGFRFSAGSGGMGEGMKPKIFTPEITARGLPKAYDDLCHVNRKEGRVH